MMGEEEEEKEEEQEQGGAQRLPALEQGSAASPKLRDRTRQHTAGPKLRSRAARAPHLRLPAAVLQSPQLPAAVLQSPQIAAAALQSSLLPAAAHARARVGVTSTVRLTTVGRMLIEASAATQGFQAGRAAQHAAARIQAAQISTVARARIASCIWTGSCATSFARWRSTGQRWPSWTPSTCRHTSSTPARFVAFCSARSWQTCGSRALSRSWHIPLAWVKGEDRKALCEQLFTQGFMSDFAGLKEASSPHFRALRKVLLPQLESGAAASSAEVGAPTPASIVRDYILLFSSPFQTDPLTKEQMQLIVEASSPGRAAATHIKLMHELLDDAWWQKQMKPAKKFSVTEATHAPKITQVLGGLASGSSEEAAEAWATLMADSGWRAWWPGMREPLADRLISAMIEQARGQVAGEAEAQHVREAASRLSWLLSELAGKGAANAEKQVAALINEARGATREADSAARLRAGVQKCSEFVATPSQEGLAALAGCFSQCEGLALETLEGKQVLDAVASILASGEFARDDALGAAEAMLGVVPDDARARDCSAGALRAGVAAARAAANVIADSDSSIPELGEQLAKIDERVSACAQEVEGLMPWWSDLQREVAEKKEQIRRAAQQKMDALAAGLRGKLREVREATQRDGTEKGWKEFLPESHSWQDVVHAMELTFWVPTRDRSSPAAQSVGRIARLDARYTSAKKEWGELESAALEIGVAVPNDTKAEYDETMRKALVAAAEEYFVRTLEEGGQGAGTAVMKRQAYIVKKDMFDYEAEILPMIKTRVQRAISDEA